MPSWRILLLCLLSPLTGLAQDTLVLSRISADTIEARQIPGMGYRWAPAFNNISEVSILPFTGEQPRRAFKKDTALWIRMLVSNDGPPTRIYLNIRKAHFAEAFVLDSVRQQADRYKTGIFESSLQLQDADTRAYLTIPLLADQTVWIYLRLYNRVNRTLSPEVFVQKEGAFTATFRGFLQTELSDTIYQVICSSALFYLMLFMLFTYFKGRQRIYLYFSFYLAGAILYVISRLGPDTLVGHLVCIVPYMSLLLNEPSQLLFFAAYNLFVIALLDVRKKDRPLYRILRTLSWIYAAYAVFLFCYLLFTNDAVLLDRLFVISRFILFPLNTALIIRTAITCRSPVYPYFLTGVVIYLSVGMVSAIASHKYMYSGIHPLGISAGNLFQLGVMAEVLCFAFALGYRSKLMEEARQKVSELENVALRSQMNPHFLFNSLNAIKYFIVSGSVDKATTYLNRFARLVRMVLEHSKEDLIPLSDELKALRLYLEIESTRFDQSFEYRIDVAQGVDADGLKIPPLLLQPFVENAIWHGLLPKKDGQKLLDIQITGDQKKVTISIADNGVGRSAASGAILPQHRSYGSKITEDRIALFNSGSLENLSLRYLDPPAGKGTIVEIQYTL